MDKLLKPKCFDVSISDPLAQSKWEHWHRTFDNFIQISQAREEEKLLLLINYISSDVYNHISTCTDFTAAIDKLKKLYIKPRNIMYNRYALSSRRQLSGESLNDFVHTLRQLASLCDFKDVTAVENTDHHIRDALISGLQNSSIRQRLLENSDLSLDLAITQALALEQAQNNSEKYSSSSSSYPLNAAVNNCSHKEESMDSSTAAIKRQTNCFFCGNKAHHRKDCPAKDATCHGCGKKGHFSKVCKTKKTSGFTGSLSTSAACPKGLDKSVTEVKINNEKVKCLLDSGSSDNFIDTDLVKRLGLAVYHLNSSVSMASSQHQLSLSGFVLVDIVLKGIEYKKMKFLLMDKLCFPTLLGLPFLSLHDSFTIKFDGALPHLSICSLAMMTTSPPRIFSNMDSNIKPIAVPSRSYSAEDSAFITTEIQRLLNEKIIEPASSPWRAQVLVVKENKKRLVIDYSQTINSYTQLDAYPLPLMSELANKIAKYKRFSKIDLKSAYHQIPLHGKDRIFTAFEANGKLYQFCRLPFGLKNAVAAFQRKMDELIEDNNLEGTFAYLDDIIICGISSEEHDKNLMRFKEVAKNHCLTLNEDKCEYNLETINYIGYQISHGSLRPDPNRMEPLKNFPLPQNQKALKRLLGLLAYYSPWIPNFSDKIRPLLDSKIFPLSELACSCFEDLKLLISKVSLQTIDDTQPFELQTDASGFSIAAVLFQNQKPVAFFSRTLSETERRYPSIELEAMAIVESVRKWRHLLMSKSFSLLTDQEAVSYIFKSNHRSKIKNNKLMRWRLELSEFNYNISHLSGKSNVLADTLSRMCGATVDSSSHLNQLSNLHNQLCHPGVKRLYHYVKTKNLAFSVDDVRKVCSSCKDCAEIKPHFLRSTEGKIINATKPFEKLFIDFIGPKISNSNNHYILMIVDEYTRFPFAFPCADMTAGTVIKCLSNLFTLTGNPGCIHSDRGSQFMSNEILTFLDKLGIARSRTTPCNNPRGNGQSERFNGLLWKSIQLALRTNNLKENQWEIVLPSALHSIRSLLNTSTNATPHELFFNFHRRTTNGITLPSWLTQGNSVMLRRYVRHSKNDPLVDEVQLIDSNPHYARVRFENGREDTVNLRDLLSSCPQQQSIEDMEILGINENAFESKQNKTESELVPKDKEKESELVSNENKSELLSNKNEFPNTISTLEELCLRCSGRPKQQPVLVDLRGDE